MVLLIGGVILAVHGPGLTVGLDMRGWHATSIGLHVLVAFLLYRLLAAAHSRDLALLLSILFGVLFANTGLIAEPWVGGYLAGCALLLAAL